MPAPTTRQAAAPRRRFVRRRLNGDEPRASDSQSAGLVEQNSMRLGQGIEGRAALDDDAAARCLRHAGDEGDGRRKYERARGGDHQNSECREWDPPTTPTPLRRPELSPAARATRSDPPANERSLGRLRGSDEPDNTGVSALLGRGRGRHLKRVARVERAAAGALPRLARDRDRLARERRLHRRPQLEK